MKYEYFYNVDDQIGDKIGYNNIEYEVELQMHIQVIVNSKIGNRIRRNRE